MIISSNERARIQAKVDQNWRQLIHELGEFTEDELHIPNVIGIWSLRDLISHLETWDQIAIRTLHYAEQGEHRPWWIVEHMSYSSIDEFNEADVEQNRHKSLAQLWTELHETHAALIERIETSPAVTAELLAVDTYDHYADHLNDIASWRRSHSGGEDSPDRC